MSFQTFHTQLQIIPVFAKGHAPTKPAETLHLQKAWMLFQGSNTHSPQPVYVFRSCLAISKQDQRQGKKLTRRPD